MNNISVTGKSWDIYNISEREIYKIVNAFNVSEFIARILISRDIEYSQIEDFLNPKIKNLLPDPLHLLDMQKAVNIVTDALISKDKIAIIGDYDVDGATSSALLKRVLDKIGNDTEIYIPDRELDGYGPSERAIDSLISKGAKVIISVDCGITAFDEIQYSKEQGVKFIILDHHISDIKLPEADAIVNPNRFDEKTKLTNLAAVGVSFLFSVALISHLRSNNYFKNRSEPNLMDNLDLVALGTTCDMMILRGLNRAFVIQGLKIMAKRQNKGLSVLSDIANIDNKISTYHLGFVIGPRINAGGRVGKSYLGSKLLSTQDTELATKYAYELEEYNEQRKIIESNVFDEAMDMASKNLDNDFLLVHSNNWHQGVIGIVAGKLKDKFNKPVAVITFKDGIGKASCRSIKGVDLGGIIIDAKNSNLIISGGGHPMAAGFSVEDNKISELQKFFNERTISAKNKFGKVNHNIYDIEISPNAVNIDTAKEISKLEPFGNGNKEPIVRVNGLFVLKANVLSNKHVSCLLSPDRNSYGSKAIRCISFNSFNTEISDTLLSPKVIKIDVIGNLKINNWQGNSTVQIIITDLI